MRTVVILVGGLGTRLRSIISDIPKPLAPVNNRPFLYFIFDSLRDAGVREVIILAGYMQEQITAACHAYHELQFKFSYEKDLLGTAGAIKNAEFLLRTYDDFILLNGDSYAPTAIKTMLSLPISRDELGAISVTRVEDTSRYGTIDFDAKTYQINNFSEKLGFKSPGFVNAGVYRLSTEILNYIPEHIACSLEKDIVPKLLTQPHSFKAVPIESSFQDIGLPEDYLTFKQGHEQEFKNEY